MRNTVKNAKEDAKVVQIKNNIEYTAKDGLMSITTSSPSNNDGELNVDFKNSFYVGRHIIRNGDRKQSYTRSPDPMLEVYHSHKELFKNFDIDVDKAITINGCFKTNKTILQRTMIPETDSFLNGYPSMSIINKFKTTINSVIRKLRIETLPKGEKEDLKFSRFDKNTYPGFFCKEYLNCNTKEQACIHSYEIACDKWDIIEKAHTESQKLLRNDLFPGTYTVGARNKRDYTYEDFEVVSSRAVHMPEFHNEIYSSVWIDPISNFIKDKKRGPIYIGNSFVEYQRMYNDLKECEDILEGDVKRFDSRVWISLIVMSVALSRLYYDLDDSSIDYHFIAIFDNIAIKDYYTPGGYIYRMIHGLPSGVKSTSLYGSFVNFILQSYFNENYNSKKINYCIGGDDFLVGLKFKINDDHIDEVNNKAFDCGWELKYLKKKSFNSKHIEDRPYFYKYTIDNNEPIISMTTLIERVFIPWNKNYNDFSKIYNFLLDIIPSLAAPRSHFLIFYELCCYVRKRYLGIKTSPTYFFELHKNMYDKVMRGEHMLTSTKFHDHSSYNIISCNNVAEGKNLYSKYLQKCKLKDVKFRFV